MTVAVVNCRFLTQPVTGVQRFAEEITKRLVRELSDVQLLGQREDANRLYQAFDAFALPSLYEGLGLVGVEAQRAGLPCLLSDAVTREADVTGTCEFLPIEDPKVWAAALSRIAEAPARDRSLSENGRLRFDDYDIEKAAPKLVACYERLVSEAERAASA